jgi:hypothetical protein
MIGQIAFTAPLLVVAVYGLLETRHSRVVGSLMALAAIATLALVWAPAAADGVAAAIRLGSRDDLILYALVGIAFLIILNLHLKDRRQTQLLTTLIREIALSGGGPGDGSRRPEPMIVRRRARGRARSSIPAAHWARTTEVGSHAAVGHGEPLSRRG